MAAERLTAFSKVPKSPNACVRRMLRYCSVLVLQWLQQAKWPCQNRAIFSRSAPSVRLSRAHHSAFNRCVASREARRYRNCSGAFIAR